MLHNKWKRILTVFLLSGGFCAVSVWAEGPGFPGAPGEDDSYGRSRRRDDKSTDVRDAQREISDEYGDLLEMVDQSQWPDNEQLARLEEVIMENRRYVKEFEDPAQVDYFILAAWVNYYQGNIPDAFRSSTMALRKDIENADAKATYAAMAILADQQPKLLETRRRRDEAESRGHSGGGVLSLDTDRIQVDMIGTNIDSFTMDCLNSTSFQYAPGQSNLAILFWQLFEKGLEEETANDEPRDPCDLGRPNQPLRDSRGRGDRRDDRTMPGPPGMGMPGMPGMPQDGSDYHRSHRSKGSKAPASFEAQIEPIEQWFRHNFDNGSIRFLGINLDDPSRRDDVIDQMFENPWPWAQAAITEKTSVPRSFAEVELEPASCLLVLTTKDGRIKYAGPSDGFLAPLVMEELLGLQMDELPPRDTIDVGSSSASKPRPTKQTEPEPAQARADEDPNPDMPMEDKYRAEKLLNTARQFMKSGHTLGQFTGYKNAIDMCREVLAKWPDSTYADEARKLLNMVPKRYHKRYEITDEELGR